MNMEYGNILKICQLMMSSVKEGAEGKLQNTWKCWAKMCYVTLAVQYAYK